MSVCICGFRIKINKIKRKVLKSDSVFVVKESRTKRKSKKKKKQEPKRKSYKNK